MPVVNTKSYNVEIFYSHSLNKSSIYFIIRMILFKFTEFKKIYFCYKFLRPLWIYVNSVWIELLSSLYLAVLQWFTNLTLHYFYTIYNYARVCFVSLLLDQMQSIITSGVRSFCDVWNQKAYICFSLYADTGGWGFLAQRWYFPCLIIVQC